MTTHMTETARRAIALAVLAASFQGITGVSASAGDDALGQAATQPNIILILADDLGYGDLSCYDHPADVRTPNIDRLATMGVRCTDGYSCAAICSPARAGLLTGRYQQRFGHYHNRDSECDGFLKQITLADALKAAGYTTGVIGKWHLGRGTESRWPNQRGFDEFYGFLMSARGYTGARSNNPIYRNTEVHDLDEGYLTDAFNQEAVAFVERHAKTGPFFLYLSYNAPHYPLAAREDYLARFNTGDRNRDVYLAMMMSVDEGVGMVLDALVKTGVDDNTLVFFLSDNGGDMGQGSTNGSLRADKGSYYEGGMRVPFLVRWPRQIPGGRVCAVPVMGFDVFPTAVAAAGGSIADDRDYDGRDMLPVLRGDSPGPLHESLFWQHDAHSSEWGMRHGNWKLVSDKAGLHLFDLEKDMSEGNDLASEHPDTVTNLAAMHQEWIATMAPPPEAPKRAKKERK